MVKYSRDQSTDAPRRRIWSVMGFGGNGITFSVIAAQIVVAGIAGRRDRDAWVFAAR